MVKLTKKRPAQKCIKPVTHPSALKPTNDILTPPGVRSQVVTADNRVTLCRNISAPILPTFTSTRRAVDPTQQFPGDHRHSRSQSADNLDTPLLKILTPVSEPQSSSATKHEPPQLERPAPSGPQPPRSLSVTALDEPRLISRISNVNIDLDPEFLFAIHSRPPSVARSRSVSPKPGARLSDPLPVLRRTEIFSNPFTRPVSGDVLLSHDRDSPELPNPNLRRDDDVPPAPPRSGSLRPRIFRCRECINADSLRRPRYMVRNESFEGVVPDECPNHGVEYEYLCWDCGSCGRRTAGDEVAEWGKCFWCDRVRCMEFWLEWRYI